MKKVDFVKIEKLNFGVLVLEKEQAMDLIKQKTLSVSV